MLVIRNEMGTDTPKTAARQMLRTRVWANSGGATSVRYRRSRRISRTMSANDAQGVVGVRPGDQPSSAAPRGGRPGAGRVDPAHARRRLVTLTVAGRKAFHANGKPLYDEFRAGLVAAGFPYERYLEDTLRLAELLESD